MVWIFSSQETLKAGLIAADYVNDDPERLVTQTASSKDNEIDDDK